MKDKLSFVRVSELNIDALATGLSELHFAVRNHKRDPAFWRWRYLHTPLGKSILIVALRGSSVVGMYGLLYLPFNVQGITVIAGLMSDHSIHPSERSWRCYSGLVEMNIVESQKDNPAFRFGIIPSNTTKLCQRLGVSTLGRVPIYSGFLNFARILEGRFLPYPLSLFGWLAHPVMGLKSRSMEEVDVRVRTVENFDNAFDELWINISGNRSLTIIKNSAYLNWRYGKFHNSGFTRLAAYRGERLEGLIVLCYTGLRNGSSILELLVRDDNPGIMRLLLLKALAKMRTERIGYIAASFPAKSQAGSVLKETGFKPWGAKLCSNPEIIVANASSKPRPELDLKNWDFSLGDWMIY